MKTLSVMKVVCKCGFVTLVPTGIFDLPSKVYCEGCGKRIVEKVT